MVRHSNTWIFNISPDNWDECVRGPTDPDVHGEEHVGNPWHGTRGNPERQPDLERGDLILARQTSADGTNPDYGIKGIWEFVEARRVQSQDEVPWTDSEYTWAIYCRPLYREFDEVYTEDFGGALSFHSMTIQGAIKSLEPEHKQEYIEELLSEVDLNTDARRRLQSETRPGFEQESLVDTESERSPSVWVEKTYLEGREYKQSGPFELGKAIYSHSASKDGRDIYKTMREADVGDVVLHLLQENGQIVGASVIDSELETDFEGIPEFDWTDEQREEGGYLRHLRDYQELSEPLDLYNAVLERDEYESILEEIRLEYTHLPYDKNRDLTEGGYLSRCPDRLASVFAKENEELRSYLENAGVDLVEIEIGGDGSGKTGGEKLDSIDEATELVLSRLDESGHSNIVTERISEGQIQQWWEALRGFQPDSYVPPDLEQTLLELEDALEEMRPELRVIADDLEIPSLNSAGPPEVVFLALLRDAQREAGVSESELNANQPKLNVIQNRAYRAFDRPDHPLVDHLRTSSPTVYKLTAPPDFWLTGLRHRACGVEDADSSIKEKIDTGDIVLLHAGGEPNVPDVEQRDGFVFGAAIVAGVQRANTDDWFATYDAIQGTRAYPYLITFDRLFLTDGAAKLGDPPQADAETEKIAQSVDRLSEGSIPIGEINDLSEDLVGSEFPVQGSIGEIDDDDEFGRREGVLNLLSMRTEEVSPVTIHREFEGSVPVDIFDGLYFPAEADVISAEDLAQQVTAALRSGKHIIFTGPPGTGKTEVAERVAEFLEGNYSQYYTGWQLTTATADWSTFDTVGGYMPDPDVDTDQLDFQPGIILSRFKDAESNVQANEPTVIDEINRANIDKAFGQLFTTLSNQSVTLPYRLNDDGGQEVELVTYEDADLPASSSQYIVPRAWRILATMNTFDKTSLYEMSYAFMRRFTFVRIGAPTIPESDQEKRDLVAEYATTWGLNPAPRTLRQVGDIWRATNTAVSERSIGPAIVRDILSYVAEHDDTADIESRLTEAVISYIFPQLEGVPEREDIIRNIAETNAVDVDSLDRAAQDMLGVSARGSDESE